MNSSNDRVLYLSKYNLGATFKLAMIDSMYTLFRVIDVKTEYGLD